MLLGITGGIACGKTETGHILSSIGFQVLDTDGLAHSLMKKGEPVYQAVVTQFGSEILADDGEIDRIKLGKLVFSDVQAREILNRLVHPMVISAAQEWMRACRANKQDAAVLVPLLFEVGWTDGWDAVVCVTAPKEQVDQRLKRRGLSQTETQKRIDAQMPLTEKAARADFILNNDGTVEDLRFRISDLIEKIKLDKRKCHE